MGEPMLNFDNGLRSGAPAARSRRHAPAHDDLDGRLAARACAASSTRSTSRSASRSRCTPERRAPRPAHAGERPLPARGGARRVPPLLRAARAKGLRRVRDARRRQRPRRAGRRARTPARSEGLQGEPDPVQPDGSVRRLDAQGDRRVQGACSTARACRRPCGSLAAATSPRPAASSPRLADRRVAATHSVARSSARCSRSSSSATGTSEASFRYAAASACRPAVLYARATAS